MTSYVSSDYESDAFTVADGILTIQADYDGLDGDVNIIPLQSNDETDFGYIYDDDGEPIILRIRKHRTSKKTFSGTRFLNLSEIRTEQIKIKIHSLDNTKGTITINAKDTEA